MPDANLVNLTRDNFLNSIKASVGSNLFRNLYVKNKQTGEDIDVLDDGELSCAYFVSVIAYMHGLIDSPHATVSTTLKKLEESGWTKTSEPSVGAVIHWPERNGHEHVGFVVSQTESVNNDYEVRTPQLRGLTMKDGREPVGYYVHPEISI